MYVRGAYLVWACGCLCVSLVCTRLHVCAFVCVYACMCHVHECICVCECVSVCVCEHVCVCVGLIEEPKHLSSP